MSTQPVVAPKAAGTEDFMPLHGIDHVELYVGNALQSAYFYVHALGFREPGRAYEDEHPQRDPRVRKEARRLAELRQRHPLVQPLQHFGVRGLQAHRHL